MYIVSYNIFLLNTYFKFLRFSCICVMFKGEKYIKRDDLNFLFGHQIEKSRRGFTLRQGLLEFTCKAQENLYYPGYERDYLLYMYVYHRHQLKVLYITLLRPAQPRILAFILAMFYIDHLWSNYV